MAENELVGLDLDSERKQRAAQREGAGEPLPIVLGGEVIATLPSELPVDVLAPLRLLDADLTLILRQAMQASMNQGSVGDVTELVVDVIAQNPALPMTALDTFGEVAKRLLTDEGFAKLLANRPSPQDYAALVKGVFRFYGVTLGEASPSSASPTGDAGETLSGTSSTNSASTPEDSGTTPEPTPSLEPAAS
jgi:hypothetical protein